MYLWIKHLCLCESLCILDDIQDNLYLAKILVK